GRPGIPSSEAALLPPNRRERRHVERSWDVRLSRLIPTHGRVGNSAGSRWIKLRVIVVLGGNLTNLRGCNPGL
ncbi:MAG: hypothetical protein HYS86_03040, partial [Candidatus Chisholmbacteria bacterium]|nr:hypothetical protein [Candidatus Chisholmbacteria bacterium]